MKKERERWFKRLFTTFSFPINVSSSYKNTSETLSSFISKEISKIQGPPIYTLETDKILFDENIIVRPQACHIV